MTHITFKVSPPRTSKRDADMPVLEWVHHEKVLPLLKRVSSLTFDSSTQKRIQLDPPALTQDRDSLTYQTRVGQDPAEKFSFTIPLPDFMRDLEKRIQVLESDAKVRATAYEDEASVSTTKSLDP